MKERLALTGASLLIAFLVAELAVRWLRPAVLERDTRVLLTDTPVVRDSFGAIRYPPGRTVRSMLLTRDGVEIDVRFRTNNLGLIDHRDYLPGPPAPRRWVFVGDSYTAGVEGGEPWVPALRDSLESEIYNLGMGATGVQHFERILQGVPDWLSPTDIVVVALSDDFFRPLWSPLVEEEEIRLCADGESAARCRERPPIAYLFDFHGETSPHAFAGTVRARPPSRSRGLLRDVLASSRLLVFVKRSLDLLSRRTIRGDVFRESVSALVRIRDRHPGARVVLVHVPDKTETRQGRYEADLQEEARRVGIEYFPVLGSCPWSADRFYPNDNHPTAEGYRDLSNCIAEHLGLAPAAAVVSGSNGRS